METQSESDVFDNYSISGDTLESTVDLPGWVFRILAAALAIMANTGLILLLFLIIPGVEISEITIGFAAVGGLLIFLLGLVGGWFWEVIGRLVATSFYLAYIPQAKDNLIGRLYRRFIDADSKIYLEARSKDHRLTSAKGIFGLVFRISISELSFFIFITALVVNPFAIRIFGGIAFYDTYRELIDPFLALGISVMILAFYLPTNFIMEDADIKTFDVEARSLDVPGRKLRSFIDGIVGIGALSSGFQLFEALRPELSGGNFLFGNGVTDSIAIFSLDYIAWLVFIMLISWPLIFPASLFFFIRYQKIVNAFRAQAVSNGIPIGVLRVRPPGPDEQHILNSYIEKSKDTFHPVTTILNTIDKSQNSTSVQTTPEVDKKSDSD